MRAGTSSGGAISCVPNSTTGRKRKENRGQYGAFCELKLRSGSAISYVPNSVLERERREEKTRNRRGRKQGTQTSKETKQREENTGDGTEDLTYQLSLTHRTHQARHNSNHAAVEGIDKLNVVLE